MDISTFSRIVRAFADSSADIDLDRGRMLMQVRDEMIEVGIRLRQGDLVVVENDDQLPAARWLINRIARLPLLADRILSHIPESNGFAVPTGSLLDRLDRVADEKETHVSDAVNALREVLDSRPAGVTSAIYLTSDAGEGKTTLISHLARWQAAAYKNRTTDWLLLPVPLGGKAFLHFDDVVIAALVNRYRFPFFYYEAFLELVKLGVLIPAFDGFEEMFIETSSGEALSALGNLVQALDSSGSIVIAARKAYFEYQSFRTQAKLFDSVGDYNVSFGRLAIDRWGREQFLQFSRASGLGNGGVLYDALERRLKADHPLLSRAVLASRLIEEAKQSESVEHLVSRLGETHQDYFYEFVSQIVEREARTKWTDKSGEPFRPLLTVEQHHELLSMVALEMWNSGVEALRPELLDLISDLFSEQRRLSASSARQIKERLKQHALLAATASPRGLYAFDHEDFRKFYLGEALGRALITAKQDEILPLLRVSPLPTIAVEQACLQVGRSTVNPSLILEALQRLADVALPTSFVKENCGAIAVGLITTTVMTEVSVSRMILVTDSLVNRRFDHVTFEKCYFQPTSTSNSRIESCVFIDCEFERLELFENATVSAALTNCEIRNLVLQREDRQLFNPGEIIGVLASHGFEVVENKQTNLQLEAAETDEELILLERGLRPFLRSTHVNEDVLRLKLGKRANFFMANVLPRLLQCGVAQEIDYHGSGDQRRFRLGVPMDLIQVAFGRSNGDFDRFIQEIQRRGL